MESLNFPSKREKLEQAHALRLQEVEDYQINIDNYILAIEAIDNLPEAEGQNNADFRKQLVDLLTSEKREQNKAKIMLQVLEKQLSVL